jgi:hypothetical protein
MLVKIRWELTYCTVITVVRQLFRMFGGDVMCAVARGTVHGVTDDEPRSTRIKQGLYPASSQENH